ncbi:hypothetical protein FE257_001465 [Aspergillus nanangensis]|uniref:Uncharacterized protein n=1 Tax=Aspergillus nanangensis TaxID=2582783 RepID=A0AAD4CDQ7_ASPNN|nr:hypothetical protein FE257_001465 [Aspergillus nanangensis]
MSTKDSLESLCIDVSYPEDDNQLGWFGSLTEYTKLRTLHLRLRDLLYLEVDSTWGSELDDIRYIYNSPKYDSPTFVSLVDTLPASLEHLYVSEFDKEFSTGLRELEKIVREKDKIPHLRAIDIEGYLRHQSEDLHVFANNLGRACEEVGIEFNILDYYIEVEHRGKRDADCKDHWSHWLPEYRTYWAIHRNLRTAKRIISPIVRQRRAEEAKGNPDYVKPNDLLQWMMDGANE